MELNRRRNTRGDTGRQAKEKTKPKAVADSENNGIRDDSREQPQRPVLATQQVVRKVRLPSTSNEVPVMLTAATV
jgi:hypothetical protein